MNQSITLEVRKDDLAVHRLAERKLPGLRDGEVLCQVDRFALTANNITYGVVGEKIGYWQFFPAEDGWGVIPVWGFADVIESQHPDVPIGERLYGYFPMGSHLVISPVSVRSDSLTDGSEHRTALPPVYNRYSRTSAEPHFDPHMEDERSLLLPLYATSYCIYDFLLDNAWFGAQQVVIISASSRTGIGLAMALQGDESSPRVVGLTSDRNLEFVRGLELHDQVLCYPGITRIDATLPTVIVDMSGSGQVLSDLHSHLGDNMRYCSNVGITHYDEAGMGPGFIAERSAMFFAPGHMQKRSKEWGPGEFQKRAFGFWLQAAKQSRRWLQLQEFAGPDGMQGAFQQTLTGDSAPWNGVIVNL